MASIATRRAGGANEARQALISALRRTPGEEEYVTEDWAAVGRAITERLNELGMKQRELATRSGVSQAIVREIQRNTVQRRRGDRTLEALATALDWHPQHLLALLHNRKPPSVGQPRESMTDPVTARLAAIEDRIADLADQLAELRSDVATALRERGSG